MRQVPSVIVTQTPEFAFRRQFLPVRIQSLLPQPRICCGEKGPVQIAWSPHHKQIEKVEVSTVMLQAVAEPASSLPTG